MEINNSDESFEEEFDAEDIPGRQSIFPSRNQIIIFILFMIVIMIFIEKILIKIFLYFIPSYLFLILIWIFLHLILLRYLVYSSIYPGKNFFVEFYLQKFYGKNRAKVFWNSLENFKGRINKILQSNKSSNEEEKNSPPTSENRSKVSSRYAQIYLKIKEDFGKLNNYETEFLNKLLCFISSIENSSLQENSKKYLSKEQIYLSQKDINDYENIIKEANNIQQLLNEFRGDIKIEFKFQSILKYLKNYFFNNILCSKKFSRISVLLKINNSKEIKIKNKDNLEIDCFIIYSNKKEEENKIISSNLVIICGPNLTPFESFINSWNLDSLYLSNDTDILLWNYRGYGFSEGSANFTNVCQDILCIYDYMTENYNYNKIIVHGLSIGGIPSCYLASKRKINLLIADRTFGSVQSFIDSFQFGNKILYYLARILLIPFVNNIKNFMGANCKKILLNDPEDNIIGDNFCLKTSISKKIIYEIFVLQKNELNIRNIVSYNILNYALEPEQYNQIYDSFKYTIKFLRNKVKNYFDNKEDLAIDKEFNNDIEQNLNDNNQNFENIDINNISLDVLKRISNNFYKKIYNLFNNFNSAGDYLINFTNDNSNSLSHLNNFFNNLFIYGCEDLSKLEYSLCNIDSVNEMLNYFIQEADNFLNSEENKQLSEYNIYKHFSFFVKCIKNLKIFIEGLNLRSIEKDYFFNLKGILIPLNCGHILFYNERELDTLKYLVQESLKGNEGNEINNKENC